MSVIRADPERLFAYAAEVLPYEARVIAEADELEQRLQDFQSRCLYGGFCPTPRGQEIARHALRGQALAEWVSAIGAAFHAADRTLVGFLPGALRTMDDADLAAYLQAVGAFPLLEQREGHQGGIGYAMQIEAAIAAGDGEGALALLRGLADHQDNPVFVDAALLTLGDLDVLEDRIDAVTDKPHWALRFLDGAWDATAGLFTTAWGLTGQGLYDAEGWSANWGAVGDAAALAWNDPGEFARVIVDWEGMKEDPARWLGGLVPDAVLAFATAGTGAAVSRGGSAARAAMRGVRAAESLGDVVAALKPLARAAATDVEGRARTIGGRQVRWTPVGFVDETGHVAHVSTGVGRGPLARLEDTIRHDPTETFRSGQYLVRRTTAPMRLFRVRSPGGRPQGNYWTAVPPRGPGQSQMDSALRPDWGNTAQEVVEIRVPPGTTIYEGIAGPQPVVSGSGQPLGGALPGGGHQVFLPDVPADWITAERSIFAPSAP